MDSATDVSHTEEGSTWTSLAVDVLDPTLPVPMTYRIVVYVVGSPLAAFILTANILLLLLLCRYPKLQTKTSLMMRSWAFADLLTGLLLVVLLAVVSIDWPFVDNKYWCLLWLSLNMIPLLLSCSHVVFLALDRYMAIKFPSRYPDGISHVKLRLYLGLAWVYALLLSFLTYLWHASEAVIDGQCSFVLYHKYYNLLILLLHCIPCVCLAVLLYAKSFLHVRRHERQVHVTHTLAQDQFLADHKTTKIFFFATVVHTLTWCPYFIALMVRLGHPSMYLSLYLATTIGLLVGFTSSAGKLVIYFWKHDDIRESMKDLCQSNKPVRVQSRACSRP